MLRRVREAGATEMEIAQLAAEQDPQTIRQRLEHVADADVREWLDGLRAAGYFASRAVETQDGESAPEEPPVAQEPDVELAETPQELPRTPKRSKTGD